MSEKYLTQKWTRLTLEEFKKKINEDLQALEVVWCYVMWIKDDVKGKLAVSGVNWINNKIGNSIND